MQAVNHQLTTGSAYISCMYALPEQFYWMSWPGFVVAMIGALLPDIDHHKSRVGRLLPFISIPLHGLLGHRGALHSLLAVFGIYYLNSFFPIPLVHSLSFGYIGHLVGDMATKSGVNLFWPVSKRFHLPLKPARNGFFEFMTTLICLVLMTYVLLHHI